MGVEVNTMMLYFVLVYLTYVELKAHGLNPTHHNIYSPP